MDEIKPTSTDKLKSGHAQTLGPTPESMAKQFFLLAMAGVLAYIITIAVLMMGSS